MDDAQTRTPKKRRRRPWEAAFLAALALTGNVTEAAESAGVPRRTVYDYRAAHEDFAAEWEAALDQAADTPSTSTRRRGRELTVNPRRAVVVEEAA